jgi:hypothetical protein
MTNAMIIYIGLATIVSVYQGYRGFRFQWLLGMKEVTGILDRVVLLCIADMILFAVCSAAGFFAVWLAFDLYTHIRSITDLSPGAAVLFLSLALFGLIGVTGQLPPLIQLGKLLPGVGGGKA